MYEMGRMTSSSKFSRQYFLKFPRFAQIFLRSEELDTNFQELKF